MEALPRWPFIAHSCANLYWQTLPITLFHNLQHSLKKYWGHIISHFGVTCKKERLPFVTTTITWRRKLKKTELTSKKEDEEKSFLQFSALYVFCNIVCDAKKWFLLEKNFSCYYQNFSWKRTVPLRFLLKKNFSCHYQNRSWKRTTIRCDLQMAQEWSWNSTLSIR